MHILVVVAGRDSKKRTTGMYIKTSRTSVRERSRSLMEPPQDSPMRTSTGGRSSSMFNACITSVTYVGKEGGEKGSEAKTRFCVRNSDEGTV